MKTPKWGMVVAVLFVALAMSLMIMPVTASPDIYPCNFWGTATVDEEPVGPGTEISAWFEGTQVALTTTGFGGQPDSQYSFLVFLDETYDGTAVISFKIGALEANETGIWRKTLPVRVDLTATTTPPAVTTNAASGITISSATLNGSLDSLGDYSSVDVSFEWGTTSGALDQGTTLETMTSIGAFSAPISGLASNTPYYFRAKATGSVTVYGVELSFTTLPDTTPPEVESTSPEDGDTDVPIDTEVTATFSEAMDSSTITVDSFTLAGSAVSGTVTYNSDTYTAIFTPDASLDYEHEYTATLSTAITDEAGNPLALPYTWSFTTGEDPPPTVVSTVPVDDATDVAIDTEVTATFSEAMDSSTITVDSFTLDDVSGTVSYGDTTATFTPDASLDYEHEYTATLSTAITDEAGNPLALTYTWSFTTEAKPAPPEEVEVEEEEEEIVSPKPELGPHVSVGNLRISPAEVSPNQPVTISLSVFNSGDRGGSKTLNLLINGELEQSTRVGIPAHGNKSFSFTVQRASPGVYSVYIEGASGWFTVSGLVAPSAPVEAGLGTGDVIAIVIIAIILIGGLTFAFLYIRRSA